VVESRSLPAAKIVWPRCASNTTEARGYNVLVLSRRLPPVNLKGDIMADIQSKVDLITNLAADKRLTDAQFRAAVALILKFHNSTNGACYPSLRQWADASTLGRSTVSEAASRLRDLGVIAFDASSGGRNRRNSYTVNVRPAEQKRSPSRTALNTRYKYNRGERKIGVFSQPQFKPEKQINIPPPEVRAAQVAARLAGLGLGVGVR
jgi:hypothetical protein